MIAASRRRVRGEEIPVVVASKRGYKKMNAHFVRASTCRLAAISVVLAASMGLARAADSMTITRVFVVSVPAAHDHAFNVGVKAWEKCLKDHGRKEATMAYDSETGDMSRYLFLNEYSTWGAMDAHDPADKACRATFETAVHAPAVSRLHRRALVGRLEL
jgi:hypothetical protein